MKNNFSNQNTNIKSNNNLHLKNNTQKELENALDIELENELEKELEMLVSKKPIIDIVLSEEQEKIVKTKSNIIVDAVAGSGKTTTILHYSLEHPEKKIFQITYNNMLKREVRKKVNRMCIPNMEIHTYHSLAVKYYDPNAYTDEEIKNIINNNTPLKNSTISNNNLTNNSEINEINDIINKNLSRPIDILFIDETQDMILDYYKLLKKFINDTNSNPQIIILGDRYQGIYDFKGANTKFLTLADKIWNAQFIKLNLSQSYRLTNQIGWFVNNIMIGYDRIKTNKSGPPVDYYVCNSYEIYKKIGKYLIEIMKNNNILPSDIFVLVPSVKTVESPYKKLENYLVKKGIKCITPSSDDSKLDDKVIANKVVFTTYHQAKGRERKVVILYNFDSSYTEFYSKEKINTCICPNILYVGATRALHKLILIQDFKSKPLDFINFSKLKYYSQNKSNNKINLIELEKTTYSRNEEKSNNDVKKINTTDLVKFISPNTLDIIINLISGLFIEVSKPSKQIDIPNKIKIENKNSTCIWEDVSDLNGLVIPAIIESKIISLPSTVENYVQEYFDSNVSKEDIKKYIGKINIPCISTRDYLKVGNLYLSLQNKLHAKLAQIKKYDWLDSKIIKKCSKRMNMITEKTLFEITLFSNESDDFIEYIHNSYGIIQFRARLDAINDENVWEFKCVDSLSIEHKLQILIYYWLWQKSYQKIKHSQINKFNLFNIKSGQILQLDYYSNIYKIEQVIELLLDEKYSKKKKLNDNEFINLCNN
jgi:hypothetical protein